MMGPIRDRQRQTILDRSGKHRRYSAIPTFYPCYRYFRLKPQPRIDSLNHWRRRDHRGHSWRPNVPSNSSNSSIHWMQRPQESNELHQGAMYPWVVHQWIVAMEFLDLRERSLMLRLNSEFFKLTDNNQVKHLAGDVTWTASIDSLTTLDAQSIPLNHFSEHACLRLSWIRYMKGDRKWGSYFEEMGKWEGQMLYRADDNWLCHPRSKYPKYLAFNNTGWWHALFQHLTHLRGYVFSNRMDLQIPSHMQILSSCRSLTACLVELEITLWDAADYLPCFLNVEAFSALERLEFHFAMVDSHVPNAYLATLLTVLKRLPTPLKSLKLAMPLQWRTQNIDIVDLPISLEHLSVSNLTLVVDRGNANGSVHDNENETQDVYTRLASYFIHLRSLHIERSYPWYKESLHNRTLLVSGEGYSPSFLQQLPFLEECCLTDVLFQCPFEQEYQKYDSYYQIHQLTKFLNENSIRHSCHLKILDLSHIRNALDFTIHSWASTPSLLFPSNLFSLEQLYLPYSRVDLSPIQTWLKHFNIPYTITKKGLECLLVSRF